MRVSAIQFRLDAEESKQASIERMAEKIDSCCGSDLIVLPETWATGYYSFDKYYSDCETENGEITHFLCEKAKKLNAYISGGSIIEEDNGKLYNTMMFISPEGKVIEKYRKIHLLGFDSRESEILSPGNKCVTVKTEFGVFGLAICYDLRFPELFRSLLDNNVDFIIISSAWAFPRIDHWRLLCQCRAIENVCYVIACNVVGTENGKNYFGHSAIINPWGVPIAAGSYDEEIITTDIFKEDIVRIRKNFTPINDRRLTSIY
ncbi:MAG: carbon-nitrogen family hydrolase [Clostridia bacterium]